MNPIQLLVISILLFPVLGNAQEICDNGIDDDLDGLVDLNDTECDCEDFIPEIYGVIPNPSFEDTFCCPHTIGLIVCAQNWQQGSTGGTSDYFNQCDYDEMEFGGYVPVDPDIPDGVGWAGMASGDTYNEYIATCLDAPLIAGADYTLRLYMAWTGKPDNYFDMAIFGSPDCGDILFPGYGCPLGEGSWEMMGVTSVVFEEKGPWIEVVLTFTPTVDANAILLGSSCENDSYCYVSVDDLHLYEGTDTTEISESGNWCEGDLMLEVTTGMVDGTWQWYKDGVALPGETSSTLDVMPHGVGIYSAVYYVDDMCRRIDHEIAFDHELILNFETTDICQGESITFTNMSSYPDDYDPNWLWDFGDGSTSILMNPTHTYSSPGTYTITLIGTEAGIACPDTSITLTVYPKPIAELEFIANGVSSEDGATGGCILNPIQFNDQSTIESSSITSWNWDFGDGENSSEENPEHTYEFEGTYTVTLIVTSDFGCTDTSTIDVVMTLGPPVELLINEPSCYGFSDGSITILSEDIDGAAIYQISDATGSLLNSENSNTANTLPSGWYYYSVDDGAGCITSDSIFLDQPAEMSVDLTVNEVQCYGDANGWARVDEVHNYTGTFDEITYIWSPNPGGVGGSFADSAFSLTAGEYTLTLNDENGCSVVVDFTVGQPDSLVWVEYGSHPAQCRLYNYQSGNGIVFGAAGGGTPDYSYLWTNLGNGETENNSTWGSLNPGDYNLEVTDAKGCLMTRVITLDSISPVADFYAISEQLNDDLKGDAPVEITLVNTSYDFSSEFDLTGDTTFLWSLSHPGSEWEITHNYFYQPDTVYLANGISYDTDVCLIAFNKNGCSDTLCKTIYIFEPITFVPVNVFSPNGDGKNDVFTFDYRSTSISEFSCLITNRWGVVVHEMNAVTDIWNGTNESGERCSNGVYFYTYLGVTDNGTILNGQGTVTLIE